MESDAAVDRFLTAFLELLPERIVALGGSVRSEDRQGVIDRSQSIAVAAAMAGATRLAHLAAEVTALAEAGGHPCTARLTALEAAACVTLEEFDGYLRLRPASEVAAPSS